jgi:hypothetical protein
MTIILLTILQQSMDLLKSHRVLMNIKLKWNTQELISICKLKQLLLNGEVK